MTLTKSFPEPELGLGNRILGGRLIVLQHALNKKCAPEPTSKSFGFLAAGPKFAVLSVEWGLLIGTFHIEIIGPRITPGWCVWLY
jgi:hypothetical protein